MPRNKKRPPKGWEQITPDEIDALADFLDREPLCETSMSVAMIDGLLTAIAIGPEVVAPSDYIPWIWDYEKGKVHPAYADTAEAASVSGWILGMNNRIAEGLMREPPEARPLFVFDEAFDHREWLAGFDIGASFDADVWRHAADEHPAFFAPLETLQKAERESDEWTLGTTALVVSLPGIRDYFREGKWRDAFEAVPAPFVRDGPKIGRNDPCPCGSGKKYKKCCGDSVPVVH